MEKILIVADLEVVKRDDSEHINETVETIYILIVSAIEKLKKKSRNDLMSTPSSTTCKRKETV